MANYAKVELLAPAGSVQSFFAALEYGADAVFCGLTSFSARAKAKNFDLEELGQLVSYAHKLNKKVYVALNTLIQEAERKELIVLLEAIETLGVDGLILQDFGLYRIAHTHFPTIPLHASTQMLVHNLAGVQVLEELGFERVVLARELSLTEIAHISNNSHLEIEHFVHGALCYSMSGHCLFSSYIDGRSGNRGRCTQPCRRRYHQGTEPGFYFSTGDLSAIELIPELVTAGVMSLKIEGRMKSAEYVAAVVAAYRTVLDARPGEEQNCIAKAKRQLESALGRKSSPGFLPGLGGADIVLPKVKGGLGKIVGRVERIQGGRISFSSNEVIHVGDRLRIQPLSDGAGQGFTVRNLYLGKKGCKVVGKGSFVTIPLPARNSQKRSIKVGLQDQIFKVATGKLFTLSEEACGRKLGTAPGLSNDVSLHVECDEECMSLTVCAKVRGLEFRKSYGVDMIPATKTPLSRETLEKVFSHSGFASLTFAELSLGELPAVVIKPSRLKAIRREFYGDLDTILRESLEKMRVDKRCQVSAELALVEPLEEGEPAAQPRRIHVVSDQVADLDIVLEHPELQFIFPLEDVFLKNPTISSWRGRAGKQIIWDLPSICFDASWSSLEHSIRTVIDLGFRDFRVNNVGQFQLFSAPEKLVLMAGPWLYILNGEALKFLEGCGCTTMCLSIEDDKKNIQKLLQGGRNSKLLLGTVYGRVDLFTSRISGIAKNGGISLQNDGGDRFTIRENKGLTLTMAEKAFSLLGRCRELQDMGLANFILDLRGLGFASSAGREVVAAFVEDRSLPGTVDLNFSRGLV